MERSFEAFTIQRILMPWIRNCPICTRSVKTLHQVSFSGFKRKRLTTDFKTSMIESVRRAAQVEDGFTMNASESLNEELKS